MELGAEFEVESSSTSNQCIIIGFHDKVFDATVDEWMRLTDNLSDCDMDANIDEEACYLPTVSGRDASKEPMVFTPFEEHVLANEDKLNDKAIRDLVPSDCYCFEWNRSHFAGLREQFTETPGPTFNMTDQTRIVDIFYKMFDNDFLDLLCTETNRYATQKIAKLKRLNKFSPTSRFQRWTPTNRDEMVSFLALNMLQELYPMADEESYFSFNGFGTLQYFKKIMSYNRYLLLKSLLHFVDNDTILDQPKLSKIQPVIDYLNEKFSSLYYPSQEIVIDESLLKWPGRLNFSRKISSHAAKVGVKIYELCESSSGYLWKYYVYAGKDKTATVNDETTSYDIEERQKKHEAEATDPLAILDSDSSPCNATAKIVYDLVEPLFHRGHTLIIDNFYNSPLLARCLKRQKTDCYGTLRLNREFVPDSLKTLSTSDLQQGEVMASYCSDLSIIVWRDANLVSMISTYHHLQLEQLVKCNRIRSKPSIVIDYNKTMRGVDRKNQYLSAQPMERGKSKIWYKNLFRRLFNTALFNCFVIYNSSRTKKIAYRQFRTILAQDLIKIHRHIDLTTEVRLTSRTGPTTSKISTGQSQTPTIGKPRLEHRHFPVRNGYKKARCVLCNQKKVLRRTVWKCLECNTNLCIEGCFMEYHIGDESNVNF